MGLMGKASPAGPPKAAAGTAIAAIAAAAAAAAAAAVGKLDDAEIPLQPTREQILGWQREMIGLREWRTVVERLAAVQEGPRPQEPPGGTAVAKGNHRPPTTGSRVGAGLPPGASTARPDVRPPPTGEAGVPSVDLTKP